MNAPAKASRRAILAAGAAAPTLALGAAPALTATPDAGLIRLVDNLIAENLAVDAATAPLLERVSSQWTSEEHAVWDACAARVTDYHETLPEIAKATPTTLEGLAAQALAVAFHLRFEADHEAALPLALARGVLALAGTPLPAWAEAAAAEMLEARRPAGADG